MKDEAAKQLQVVEPAPAIDYDHIWYWRAKLPDRKGQRCAVIARGKMNSVLVEFEDGYRVITSRYAVRKAGGEQ